MPPSPVSKISTYFLTAGCGTEVGMGFISKISSSIILFCLYGYLGFCASTGIFLGCSATGVSEGLEI